MSFLDSILSSIQTGKPSQPPLSQAPSSPVPSAAPKKEERKPSAVRQAPPTSGNVGGTKRKADEPLPRPPRPQATNMPNRPVASKPTVGVKSAVSPATSRVVPKPSSSANSKPLPPKPAAPNPAVKGNSSAATRAGSTPKVAAKPTPAAAAAQSKPPPKGSFAAIMAQAKAAQDKAPVQVGMLKHQAGPKERLSKIERKKRQEEEQAKEKQARSGKKAVPGVSSKDKPARQRGTEELSYKGTAKPTQTPEPPTYRGTAGLPSKRGAYDRRHQSRNSRQNEYLATDEEDEGDYGGYGGYDDYYSDASSDMEAGMDDVDREEAAALKFAKREDEEELRQEMAAKKEKLARMAELASRRR
ncbi:Chromatin SPT2 [Penicillium brevicompactum]|uniref:Chromatin SPT2 n=1 Tax=Penicillium brevicompactum TaxID=5074 RepID=UPI00254057AF|nr:Chromatin SPT2 [Penicillium brevicompactum]KAJ5347140.1 Chromatin SPT2 [Penicillium brevicompactum]